jgi:hypothetical protein
MRRNASGAVTRRAAPADCRIPIGETNNCGRERRCVGRTCTLASIAVLSLVVIAGCRRAPGRLGAGAPGGEWHEFQGTWIATGTRKTIELGPDRRASIANYTGSLLLSGASRPAVGFRAEAIVFSDTATGMTGRAVWTDQRGDEIFSELVREGTGTQNKFSGTFSGGTGRYTDATGTYQFSWRFVIEANDGTVQGQSMGLTGRIRLGQSQATTKGNRTTP